MFFAQQLQSPNPESKWGKFGYGFAAFTAILVFLFYPNENQPNAHNSIGDHNHGEEEENSQITEYHDRNSHHGGNNDGNGDESCGPRDDEHDTEDEE